MESKIDSVILDFVSRIDHCKDFDQCFHELTFAAEKLGFDGVLYTYLPRLFTDENVDFQPIMRVSENYGADYLQHYQEHNYIAYDHMVAAAQGGENRIADWFYDAEQIPLTGKPLEVLETARKFGIRNGLSFPTFLSDQVFAGASFICRKDDAFFKSVCRPNAQLIRVLAEIFHYKVIAEQHYQEVFIGPFLAQLSATKLKILKLLATGQRPKQIASELGNTIKYTQNLIGEIRKDFGNVPRDRLMYLVGVLNIERLLKSQLEVN